MEVLGLENRSSGMVVILLLAVLVAVSFGMAQDSSIISGNQKTNETDDAAIESKLLNNAAGAAESNRSAVMNVQGIWKFSLEGTDILMALNQSVETIFGLAKNEADNPWNGVAAGSLFGNVASISLSAIEGDVVVSTYISGTVEGDLIKGSYVRSDGSGVASSGKFTAIMISPDNSAFEPVPVEPISKTGPSEQTQNTVTKEEPEKPVQEMKSRFRDVTDLAKGINPNIMPRMAPI
jgi:hypothetical protein